MVNAILMDKRLDALETLLEYTRATTNLEGEGMHEIKWAVETLEDYKDSFNS